MAYSRVLFLLSCLHCLCTSDVPCCLRGFSTLVLHSSQGFELTRNLASHPNYANFEHLLSPGWIPGRKVDNSDTQYSFFRDNVPYMLALLVAHPLVRKLYNAVVGQPKLATNSTPAATSESRLEQRLRFDFGFAFIFLGVLHGFSIFKVFLILYVNYSIAKKLPANYIVPITWIFCLTTLFANELCAGYPYQRIAGFVSPALGESDATNWGSWLDSRAGLVSRWEVLFNITVLRMISFNVDHYWALNRSDSNAIEVSLSC